MKQLRTHATLLVGASIVSGLLCNGCAHEPKVGESISGASMHDTYAQTERQGGTGSSEYRSQSDSIFGNAQPKELGWQDNPSPIPSAPPAEWAVRAVQLYRTGKYADCLSTYREHDALDLNVAIYGPSRREAILGSYAMLGQHKRALESFMGQGEHLARFANGLTTEECAYLLEQAIQIGTEKQVLALLAMYRVLARDEAIDQGVNGAVNERCAAALARSAAVDNVFPVDSQEAKIGRIEHALTLDGDGYTPLYFAVKFFRSPILTWKFPGREANLCRRLIRSCSKQRGLQTVWINC